LAISGGLVVLIWFVLRPAKRWPSERLASRVMVPALSSVVAMGAALLLPNTLNWKSDSPYMETARSVVNYKQGSGRGRLVQYKNTGRMSLHHPLLGVGPGNWAVIYPKFASNGDPSLTEDGMTANPWPSSDWMTFVSERGLLALVLLALAVVSLIVDAIRALREPGDSEQAIHAWALLGTLAVLLVVGTFDAVLLLPPPALVGWALLGALSPPPRERVVVELPPTRRIAAMAVVAILGGLRIINIIIRNSVILIAQIDQHIADGEHPWAAVISATEHRLRPILLTAAAAILGMIPIAPTVFWGPMAYAVMGGLVVATLLTLVFLPALYVAWFRIEPVEARQSTSMAEVPALAVST